MKYRLTKNSSCYHCSIADKGCKESMKNITKDTIYKNLGSNKMYIFVHDRSECGGLTEIEEY